MSYKDILLTLPLALVTLAIIALRLRRRPAGGTGNDERTRAGHNEAVSAQHGRRTEGMGRG